MATIATAWKKSDGPVRYYGGKVDVRPGDLVEVGWLFRKRRGVVNYVPGISGPHGEMEHGGLYWVGVSLSNGTIIGTVADPDTGCLRKKVAFLERGAVDAATPLPPEPFE
jgi:hypothetical protein